MSTSPAQKPNIEPWMRGTHTDVPAVGRAVLHALELAIEDLKRWTDGLSDAEIHSQPFGLMPIARHLRHIARSTDRILTYAEDNQLNEEQLKALKAETEIGDQREESLGALLAEIESSFGNAAERIRTLAASDLESPRGIGRKQLPASAGGALIHVADHAQRHVGQVITTAKVLKALRG